MSLTTAQRAAIPLEDYAWPDAPGGPKYPITSQARLDAAAKLIGFAPKRVQPRIRARAIAIGRRKGYDIPDAWQATS